MLIASRLVGLTPHLQYRMSLPSAHLVLHHDGQPRSYAGFAPVAQMDRAAVS